MPEPPSAWRPSRDSARVRRRDHAVHSEESRRSLPDPQRIFSRASTRFRLSCAAHRDAAALRADATAARDARAGAARDRPGGDFGNVRGALRRVAEGLLDLGVDDARLVSGVAALRDHEQALASLEAAQETRY
ncbi:MAG TPA: hypothetical protein VGK65_22960 [Candidatus Binatia bacterium]